MLRAHSSAFAHPHVSDRHDDAAGFSKKRMYKEFQALLMHTRRALVSALQTLVLVVSAKPRVATPATDHRFLVSKSAKGAQSRSKKARK